MLLTKEEFMTIKAPLVEDVLDRLRLLARLEAELLFQEFHNYPGSLPHFSDRISFAIAKVRDAVADALANVQPTDQLFVDLLPLIKDSLPKKLAEIAGDRITTHFPVQYQRNAIASSLASMLVYHEGIHLVEAQPAERLASRAVMYFQANQRLKKVIHDLEQGNGEVSSEQKSLVVDLLKKGGARSSLNVF